MGQTIGWRKFNPDGSSDWEKVSEWMDDKWAGRFEWFITIFGGEIIEASPRYDDFVRPQDFATFRKNLDALVDQEVINQYWPNLDMSSVRAKWEEATKYLEDNSDVYVNYG
jgi:hypothetical protein